MRPIEVAELDLLAERSRKVAELAHLLAEAAARHAERVEAGDAERRRVARWQRVRVSEWMTFFLS